ncbi:Prefoldin_subunit 2 [Hexamita inflata]|uniref:Prefoldin subunit 2 n=1 Tax=Hexamita inflata TaxID=28002 RepID=A0AA86QYM5_9EUKA|nr:Prefoldin subunit 2 [Hexamita inflata]
MAEENQSQQQLKANLIRMKQDLDVANERYVKARNELREHIRVDESLKELDDDRVAYRIIGEVLAKQTVKEVRPYVKTTIQQLEQVIAQMEQFLNKRSAEIQEYQAKNQIKM